MALSRSCVLVLAAVVRSSSASFVCDGGKLTLPDSNRNDDFCDCIDGSDEPETGACPNAPFTCACRPHKPKVVFASRVNDGVCDCCDGADEWSSAASCPNTCVSKAKAEMETAQRATVARVKRVFSGQKAAAARKERLDAARASLAAGDADLSAARAAKDLAEANEAQRRSRRETLLAEGAVASGLKLSELRGEELRVVLARISLADSVRGADALHDVLSAVDAIREKMKDVDSADVIMVAMEAKEEREAAGGGSEGNAAGDGAPPADECAHSAQSCGHEQELLDLLPLESLDDVQMRLIVQSFAQSSGGMALLVTATRAMLAARGETLDDDDVAKAIALLEPFVDADADGARAALAQLEEKEQQSRKTLDELEPVELLEARGDFGERYEWFALHEDCYDLRAAPFSYKLCPFSSFTQDGRSLGNYSGWQPAGQEPSAAVQVDASGEASPAANAVDVHEASASRVMAFSGGEECNGVPRRATVSFECGEDDALLAVSEPSTCVYVARFRTPSVCSTDSLRSQHFALAEAAKEAGLTYEPSEELRSILGL